MAPLVCRNLISLSPLFSPSTVPWTPPLRAAGWEACWTALAWLCVPSPSSSSPSTPWQRCSVARPEPAMVWGTTVMPLPTAPGGTCSG